MLVAKSKKVVKHFYKNVYKEKSSFLNSKGKRTAKLFNKFQINFPGKYNELVEKGLDTEEKFYEKHKKD